MLFDHRNTNNLDANPDLNLNPVCVRLWGKGYGCMLKGYVCSVSTVFVCMCVCVICVCVCVCVMGDMCVCVEGGLGGGGLCVHCVCVFVSLHGASQGHVV